ncbi:adenosylcobinamide-phosphate synthase CbiB [Hyella patelloides]|uniref:adenosylcobinamide-phosphate synthase CbiB n=1 Tax=Hyella patelloides TaxID=1982969 RepID=UPI001FE58F46|nr:adenosylcobinamide-phosphate synthase CbiB [Hyella patelloides]
MFLSLIPAHAAFSLLIAAVWDYIIGDPRFLIHPVQIMGWIIQKYTELTVDVYHQKWQRRLSGIILGLSLVVGSGIFGWLVVKFADDFNRWLGYFLEVILLASCFAGRSLRKAAEEVLQPLLTKDVTIARSKLSIYVGRDTDNLSTTEILRAVLETVGENAVDGITAPLFYAILGVWLGIGGVPLALAYKAASTLDSMIGYLREPYIDIGWFSAQLEDLLTWLPCRLTVLTLAVFSGKPRKVLAICRRDAILDPSPNSGWSECVYAAILGVQLGGVNTYKGEIKEKPLLGNPDNPITPELIEKALNLTRYCFLLWLAVAVISYQ